MSDALNAADNVIKDLSKAGLDYSSKRGEIADVFENYLWNGNWDMSTDFPDDTPNLRFIQEDEYDQHMEEDGPEDYIVYSEGHYVFVE